MPEDEESDNRLDHLLENEEESKRVIPNTTNVYVKTDNNKQMIREPGQAGKTLVLPQQRIDYKS